MQVTFVRANDTVGRFAYLVGLSIKRTRVQHGERQPGGNRCNVVLIAYIILMRRRLLITLGPGERRQRRDGNDKFDGREKRKAGYLFSKG